MLIQHHWQDNHKIRQLVLLTKRKDAPLHLLRLWSYCEVQKSEYIEKNALQLAVICFWDEDPEEWLATLQECELIRVERENDGGQICFRVHQWEYHNRGLMKRSKAGKKGAEERERRRKLEVSDQKSEVCGHKLEVSGHEAEAEPRLHEAEPGFASCSRVEESRGE